MIIQFNTDRNIPGSEEVKAPLVDLITDGLYNFSKQITRVEAHLSDENGNKNTPNDKRCVLEARVEGRPAIAVTNFADTHEQAVTGAVDKLKASLEKSLGKLSNH